MMNTDVFEFNQPAPVVLDLGIFEFRPIQYETIVVDSTVFEFTEEFMNSPRSRFWDPVKRKKRIDYSMVGPKPDVHVDDIDLSSDDNPLENLFNSTKNSLQVPFDKLLEIECKPEDTQFIVSSKRCYSGAAMRDHLPLYLNYFETYYDTDHLLIMVLQRIKYMIDYVADYSFEDMMKDIDKYILHSPLSALAMVMVNDNYKSNLDDSRFTNDKNLSLVYRDKHAKLLFWMSLLQNMVIPLATEFIYMRNIQDTSALLMRVFDPILKLADGVNVINKLFQTANTNISKRSKLNEGLWSIQDIRGKTITTHSMDSVQNIVLNIMPKYIFNTSSIVSFNHASIKRHDYFQVSGIPYEFEFVPLNSGTRDAENVSSWDKYESYMVRQSPLVQIHHNVAAKAAMDVIDKRYGPFDTDEINFIINRLTNNMTDVGNIIVSFQHSLIMDLFNEEFGDPITGTQITSTDYVKLMIAARRKLIDSNMIILPYLITSKIQRFQIKKNVSKRILDKIQSNPLWESIQYKYDNNEQIENYIKVLIGTILTSEFRVVSYEEEDIDDRVINIINTSQGEELFIDEFLRFIMMI